MATATINATNMTTLSTCESATGWTGVATLDTEVRKQGTYSLSGTLKTVGLNTVYYTTSVNIPSDKSIRIWLNFSAAGFLSTKALGGIRVYAYSGTATAYWYVGGEDTYDGGWVLLTVNPYSTPSSGTCNPAAITRVGICLNLTGAPRNVVNTWVDFLVYGSGYAISGGTSGDRVIMDSIAVADKALGYGVCNYKNGVYFLNSDLTLGHATSNCYFSAISQLIVFEDIAVPYASDLYTLTILGSATSTTDIVLTDSVIKSASSTIRFNFTANTASIDSLVISGTTFIKGGTLAFYAGQSITNCLFQDCLSIVPSTATFTGHTISGSTSTTGCLQIPLTNSVSNCTFTSNNVAIEIAATGTYDFTNMVFSGNTTDVRVSATTGTVTINVVGGSSPSYTTAGATVSIVNAKSLVVYGLQANSEVRIYRVSDMTELGGIENSTSSFTYNYNHTVDVPIYVVVHHVSYEYLRMELILNSTGLSVPVQQRVDRNYKNP